MRLVIAGMLSLMVGSAGAETVGHFYDEHGNPRGSLSKEGSRLYERDQNGNARGYYTHEGDRIIRHDTNGNTRGYMKVR